MADIERTRANLELGLKFNVIFREVAPFFLLIFSFFFKLKRHAGY